MESVFKDQEPTWTALVLNARVRPLCGQGAALGAKHPVLCCMKENGSPDFHLVCAVFVADPTQHAGHSAGHHDASSQQVHADQVTAASCLCWQRKGCSGTRKA